MRNERAIDEEYLISPLDLKSRKVEEHQALCKLDHMYISEIRCYIHTLGVRNINAIGKFALKRTDIYGLIMKNPKLIQAKELLVKYEGANSKNVSKPATQLAIKQYERRVAYYRRKKASISQQSA